MNSMRSLRQNKLWLGLVLVLAVVSSLAGGPVQAFAGDASSLPGAAFVSGVSLVNAADSDHCEMPAQSRPCCCGPSVNGAADPHARVARAAKDCGCSLEQPHAPAPAEPRVARLMAVADYLSLPVAQPVVELPLAAPWVFAAPTNGPPRAAFRASTPSRAPPAC